MFARPPVAIGVVFTPAAADSARSEIIGKAFGEDAAVQSFMMLDDRVALAFVEAWPLRQSGLFLVDTVDQKISMVITSLGHPVGKAKDLSGNVWSIINGEADVPGYIEDNFSAVLIRRIAPHRYEVSNMWLAAAATTFESKENLCLYFKDGKTVNLNAAISKVSLEYHQKADVIAFDILNLTCPSLVERSVTMTFLPLKFGFHGDNQSENENRIGAFEFPEPGDAPNGQTGADVRIVNSYTKKTQCHLIRVISNKQAVTPGTNVLADAIGVALHDVAVEGGNGMYIISKEVDPGKSALVTAEALRCEFW